MPSQGLPFIPPHRSLMTGIYPRTKEEVSGNFRLRLRAVFLLVRIASLCRKNKKPPKS